MSALAIVAYLYSIIAIAILAIKARELVGIFKKGQPDPTRSSNRGARLRNMLKEVLGHTKMLRFTGTGIAHWFVMVGFGALLGTLITAFGQVIDPHFYIPGLGQFTPYLWIVEAIAWLTGIGIVTLIGIRQVTRIRNRGRASRFYGFRKLEGLLRRSHNSCDCFLCYCLAWFRRCARGSNWMER